MYSLTIHFGPNALQWQFLFKEKEAAETAWKNAYEAVEGVATVDIKDDFGQVAMISQVSGCLMEDLDLVEEARIQRSLINARGEVKARQRAATDPIIRAAQAGPQVLSPNFRQ